jgi:glutathione synthase/RimK-type ligase-like ATP-grasp enzyme
VALTASLGLEMGGIDLKRTPEGEYVCFEVNPSPAYSCFDRESAEAVAEALVIHLSGGARHGSRRKRNPLESTLA